MTLPIIAPAVVAGWMLAFTLSLDDLVIASFTTGPGSATLPIRIYSRGAARREAGDQRRLHPGDRPDRGGDRGGVAGLETVERRGRECCAVVGVLFRRLYRRRATRMPTKAAIARAASGARRVQRVSISSGMFGS